MIKVLNTQSYLVNEESISNIEEYEENYFQYSIENSGKRLPAANSYKDLKQSDENEAKKSKKEVASAAVLINHDDEFNSEAHFYPQVLETKIHPLVYRFFNMGNQRIINRYKQMNPFVDLNVLRQCLEYKPKHFKYAG